MNHVYWQLTRKTELRSYRLDFIWNIKRNQSRMKTARRERVRKRKMLQKKRRADNRRVWENYKNWLCIIFCMLYVYSLVYFYCSHASSFTLIVDYYVWVVVCASIRNCVGNGVKVIFSFSLLAVKVFFFFFSTREKKINSIIY